MDNYHLTKKDDQWKLKLQGAERASKTFDTKKEALKKSAEFMQEHPGSLKIHFSTKPGIQEERTYPRSADPRRSKG